MVTGSLVVSWDPEPGRAPSGVWAGNIPILIAPP